MALASNSCDANQHAKLSFFLKLSYVDVPSESSVFDMDVVSTVAWPFDADGSFLNCKFVQREVKAASSMILDNFFWKLLSIDTFQKDTVGCFVVGGDLVRNTSCRLEEADLALLICAIVLICKSVGDDVRW